MNPRNSASKKTVSKELLIILAKLAATLFFFIAVFAVIKWQIGRMLSDIRPEAVVQQSAPEKAPIGIPQILDSGNPPISTSAESPRKSLPAGQAGDSTVLKASFTELFSGTGWKNENKSTAYQDLKTTIISFPPAYDLKEIPALSDGFNNETIIAAKGNGKEVVLAAKSGKIFEFQPVGGDSPNIRTVSLLSPAPLKDALLDYDDSAGVWVVAAVSENGSIEAGSLNNIVSLNVSGTIDDFACANGECLLSTNSAIYSFSEVNPSLRASLSFRALRGIPEILRFTQDDNPSLRGASAASNEAISNNQPFSVSIGKAGNVLIVGAVEKTRSTSSGQAGSAYSGSIFKYSSGSLQSLIINDQSLFSSDYPGTIHFGYDSENDKILAVYAAYVGQAKLFPLSSLSSSSFSYTSSAMLQHSTESLSSSSYDDYSSFFPQRVMEGMTKGEVRFEPELFFKNGVWWAGPSAKSQVQKIVRIENGVTNDITDSIADDKSQSSIINNQSSLLLASGFGDRQIYIIASGPNATKIFLLTDNGFETKNKVVWESSNLNQWNKQLTGGTIVRADADENRGTLNYFLSADGGQNWLPAKLGEAVVFPKGKTEKDFRYRIELSPGSSQFQSPWVDAIEVEYSVAPQ